MRPLQPPINGGVRRHEPATLVILLIFFAINVPFSSRAAAGPIEVFAAALGGSNHEFGSLTPTEWRLRAGHGATAGMDWYLTTHFSAEVATGDESERARVNQAGGGSFHVIPSAALIEYHPVTDATLEPYLGAGVSYLVYRGGHTTPFGRASQPDHAALMTAAGFDYVATRHWRLMLGAEYGPARSTAEVIHPAGRTEKIDFHQLYVATGVRYRF